MEHLNDPEEAFVAFIEGQLWNEAVQLMHSHNRQRYTYRVLQTIQMKLILVCVWAALKLL